MTVFPASLPSSAIIIDLHSDQRWTRQDIEAQARSRGDTLVPNGSMRGDHCVIAPAGATAFLVTIPADGPTAS